jgi:hypothetical protein
LVQVVRQQQSIELAAELVVILFFQPLHPLVEVAAVLLVLAQESE